MTPPHTATDNWLDAMAVAAAFTESPPRRRMVRPLRQQIDLHFVQASEAETRATDPACYDHAGHASWRGATPGRLLNVRV